MSKLKNADPAFRSHYPAGPKGDAAWRAYISKSAEDLPTPAYTLYPSMSDLFSVRVEDGHEVAIKSVVALYEDGHDSPPVLDVDSALFMGETLVAVFLMDPLWLPSTPPNPRVIRFV